MNNISTSTTRSGTRFSRVQSETETEIETATNLISNQSQQAIATKTSNKDVSNDGADKRNNTKDESVGKEITANSETNSYNETLLKVMTDEVTCSICMDIIVKATVSNPCGHLFCARCLKRALSNTECCPVCRTRITSRTRSIAIDNIIRSMAMRGDFTISDFQNYLARSSTKLSKKELDMIISKCRKNFDISIPTIAIPSQPTAKKRKAPYQHPSRNLQYPIYNVFDDIYSSEGGSADNAIVLD